MIETQKIGLKDLYITSLEGWKALGILGSKG